MSWMKLWDMALDQEPCGTNSLQAFYQELTRPQFKPDTCHLCGCQLDVAYFYHYTLPPSLTLLFRDAEHINSLIHGSLQIFEYAIYYQLCMYNTHAMPFLAFCASTLKYFESLCSCGFVDMDGFGVVFAAMMFSLSAGLSVCSI